MKTLIILVFCSITIGLVAQTDSVQLLKPTGLYPVGTMVYEWMDENRIANITANKEDKRTIIVQIWYPAKVESDNQIAPYSSLSNDYQKVISNSCLRPVFNEKIDKSNLVIVSPGRGTERYLYTTIIEELASHGYLVAAIDMPEIGYVIYQDGLTVKPSNEFKPPRGMMGGPYEKVDSFFEKPTKIGSQDLEFALAKISELNIDDPNHRFTNRVNLNEIAIIGHSLGGRIAGKFTYENENVKAYLSMEGIPPRDIRYNGKIKIPQVMLCSSGTWPYAKDNYFSLIKNRSQKVYMIELPNFGHNSITDNPFIYPQYFNYSIDPVLGLEISREIILGYLDSQLKNKTKLESILDGIDLINYEVYE